MYSVRLTLAFLRLARAVGAVAGCASASCLINRGGPACAARALARRAAASRGRSSRDRGQGVKEHDDFLEFWLLVA